MVDAEKLAGVFKLLSVEARISIVKVLKRRGMCVTELISKLGITPSATSQHLRVLRDANLVKFQKRGFNVYYSLDVQNIGRIHKAVSKLFEQDRD